MNSSTTDSKKPYRKNSGLMIKYGGPTEQDFSEDDDLILFLIFKSEDHCRFSTVTLLIVHSIA